MAVKKESASKVRKKHWFPVISPKNFGERVLGEMHLHEAGDMEGRKITTNLMNLSGNVRHQNVNVTFLINKVDDNKGFAEPFGYKLVSSTIRRLIKRRKNRIDDSFTLKTKDGVMVRIKPLLITRSRTNKSVVTRIRRETRNFLMREMSKLTFMDFFEHLVAHRLQNSLKGYIKKIHPLGICEIRLSHLEKEKKPEEAKTEETKEEAPEKAEKPEEKEEKKQKPKAKKQAKPKKKEEAEVKEEIKEEKAETKEAEGAKPEEPKEEKPNEVKEEKAEVKEAPKQEKKEAKPEPKPEVKEDASKEEVKE